ncbi:cellulose biosynthesis protein BcsE [Trinickia dabaoshanensis]|uniref:Cellulose biosynthesis protein BcsE n=1 Tax=Trinickia dabaoshanensis TaxID=564714 RepID=A0A2N7VCS6_9BURK|nr:cellulose biosynthesis protein BcsE [Trinickia dabaoshanensis]PMS14968.1 cellulose biosynthesis protein BcsE [Trinickia dabaoshanensis]
MEEGKQPAPQRDDAHRPHGAGGIAADAPAGRGLGVLLRDAVSATVPAGSRLAIEALPDEVALLAPGHFYAIYAKPRTTACDALIWGTAKAARTRYVTLVLARTRERAAARMRELGFGASGAARGWPRNLNVLAMPEGATDGEDAGAVPAGAPPPGTRVAFARLFGGLRALKRFGFRQSALYLVEGAERWLTWGDPDALAREANLLANWCAARRIALVLLLDPTKIDDGKPRDSNADGFMSQELTQQPGYLELHGACGGVARMGRTHGELLWHVEFWRAGRALATGETRALRFTEDGRLSVAPEVADSNAQAALRLARDESRVVVTRAVVANESWVPPEWELVDDQQAAVAACVGAQAATVLLDFRDRSTLEPLCAAVHALRRECGRALKIVVVERREALRHQYELLLLSLGANLIVGRELPFSRVQSLLRSLQGQLDTRPIAHDYRAALAAALTDEVRGYLPVAAFCERIEAVLARGAVLDLPHVLAKVTLLPDIAHAQALKHCAPRRAGDVATADAAHLYVFLFACRLPDADVALAHIFTVPVEHLSDRVVYLAEASIEREIEALAEANRRAPIADYSDLFSEAAPSREPRRAAAIGEPGDTPPDAATPGDAASQLMAVESMLEKINREGSPARRANGAPDEASAAGTRPAQRAVRAATVARRAAQPWPMPLRGEESPK